MHPQHWRRAVLVALAFVPYAACAADAPDAPSFADVGLHSIRERDPLGLTDRTMFVGDRQRGFIDRVGKVLVSALHACAWPSDHRLAFVPGNNGSVGIDRQWDAVRSRR